MPPLRISIALATFQGARFLPEQLASFLEQTRLPDELCVSDDGSTDNTLELIRDFARSAPFPVDLQSNPNPRGSNKNFETVVQRCTGDVILFSDQDDVWLPEHIDRLVTPMEKDPRIVAVASNSRYVDEKLVPTGIDIQQSERFPNSLRDATMRLPRNQFELVLRQRMVAGHGMAFRSKLLPLLVPFSERGMYDHWVFTLAAAAGYVSYASIPLTLHRQHQRQDHGNRKIELKDWAARSANRPEGQDRREEENWTEMLARVREHKDILQSPETAAHALEQKLNFVVRRARARRASIPVRLAFATRELILGRYHRWGRGLLTFGRDLYGSRG
jgi:glycosyltransferase involved in cell wall biosynthesis